MSFKDMIKAILEAFRPRPTIEIALCDISGQRANEYCTGTIKRRYYVEPRPGEPVPPAETCMVHAKPVEPPQPPPPPPPPAYPPQADTTEPRTGLDVYQLIVFPLEQIRKYLDDLVTNGGSILRVFFDFTWPWELLTAGWLFSIFKRVGWWRDKGGAFDGQRFPLFTIAWTEEYGDPWNEDVLAKWAAVLKMCAERRIRVTLCLFDGCSMKAGIDKRHQPLLQNIQHHGASEEPGVLGDPTYEKLDGSEGRAYGEHTGGVFGGFGGDGGTMKSYLPAIVAKAVELLNASGVDYRVMPGNEMERPKENDQETQEYLDGILFDWHDFMIRLLNEQGVPNEKIVVSVAGQHTREGVALKLKERFPGIIEQLHGPNSLETLERFLDQFPGAEIDGDGMDNRAAGYTNSYGFTMPSIDQCQRIREILVARLVHQYSTFNGFVEEQGWQDLAAARWEEQRALAGLIG